MVHGITNEIIKLIDLAYGSEIVVEATWILCNLASGYHEQTEYLVNS